MIMIISSQIPIRLWMLSAFWLWTGSGLTAWAAPSVTSLWSYASGGALLSSPALGSNGAVYVGSYDEYLYAINATNGQLLWRYSVQPTRSNEDAYIFSSPAVGADGTIYFGTDHELNSAGRAVGEFFALNPNGTLKWMYPVGAAIYSDPALGADGTIYFGCFDTNLYALNPNGTLKWKFLAGDQIYSDPVIGPDGAVYFGCDNGLLYALNTNGTLRWSFNTGRVITSSPAIGAGGVIYVGSLSSNLFSVNPSGGTNWVFPTGNRIESSPAVGADGTIYVGCNNGHLYAVNPDGTQKWSALLGSRVQSSPALAQDGTIYVGTDAGELRALDASGNPLWSALPGGTIYSSPVIAADGTVVVGSSASSLYAFPGSSRPQTGPWPMFRHDAFHTARVVPPLPANTPPMLWGLSNKTVHAGTPAVLVAFNVADAETSAANLSVSGISSNLALVPAGGWTFGGSGSNRTVNVLPAAGQLGTAAVTLTVTDSGLTPMSASAGFVLNVVPAPSVQAAFSGGTNLVLSWNAIAGATYRVQRKQLLEDALWLDVPGDFTASGTTASKQANFEGFLQGFFRILVLSQP